jgi:hypothetical protein
VGVEHLDGIAARRHGDVGPAVEALDSNGTPSIAEIIVMAGSATTCTKSTVRGNPQVEQTVDDPGRIAKLACAR